MSLLRLRGSFGPIFRSFFVLAESGQESSRVRTSRSALGQDRPDPLVLHLGRAVDESGDPGAGDVAADRIRRAQAFGTHRLEAVAEPLLGHAGSEFLGMGSGEHGVLATPDQFGGTIG